jgi:hypothetical protein
MAVLTITKTCYCFNPEPVIISPQFIKAKAPRGCPVSIKENGMNFQYLVDLCRAVLPLKNRDKAVETEFRRDLFKAGSALLGASALIATKAARAVAKDPVTTPAVKQTMFTLDLVGDGNSFVSCRVDNIQDVLKGKRGDSFLVQSGLYKGGTISPSTLPGTSGSLGNWYCWGVYNIDAANALRPGPIPPFLSTELFQFNNGDEMVTFGGEFIIPSFSRVLAGGTGQYAFAKGIMEFQAIGVNATQGTNGRYIIRFIQ